MTKKGIIFQVSGIILLMIVILLSSCSQAAMTGQDNKINDSIKKRVYVISENKRILGIPHFMEEKDGWDWVACAQICMAYIDPNWNILDQKTLSNYGPWASEPLANANNCIRMQYKKFKGYSTFYEGSIGTPTLKFWARESFDKGHIVIEERMGGPKPGKKFTVVLYGYDLDNNLILYFNPHTGFSDWVNYSTFLMGYYENGYYSQDYRCLPVYPL